MIHPQLKELINLYDRGSELCDKYRADISRIMSICTKLTNDEYKQLPPSIQALPHAKINTQDFTNSPDLKNLYLHLSSFSDWWPAKVRSFLSEIPQRNLLIRFNTPFEASISATVRQQFNGHLFSKDMRITLDLYDFIKNRVERLPDIIKDCEAILPPPATQPQIIQDIPNNSAQEIVYRLDYNLRGEIRINDLLVHKCKLDSALDKALAMSIDKPRQAVKIQGSKNVGASLGHSQIPAALRKLFFRFSKAGFILNPEITAADLTQNNLNRNILDAELSAAAEKMQQLHPPKNR